MKTTNKNNYPQIIVNACEYNRKQYKYVKGALSATTLLKPAHQWALQQRMFSEGYKLEEDVSDMIWALYGSIVGEIIERGSKHSHMTQELFTAEIEGHLISGSIDLSHINDGLIIDGKTTRVATYNDKKKWDKRIEDWKIQLNIYAVLMELNGYPIHRIQNLVMFRDHRDSEKKWSKNRYPVKEILTVEHTIDMKWTTEWIVLQAELFKKRKQEYLDSENQQPCFESERWKRATYYRVIRKGAKKALKNYKEDEVEDAHEKAHSHAAELGDDYEVLTVEGANVRCEGIDDKVYCNVRQFCNFYNEEVKK